VLRSPLSTGLGLKAEHIGGACAADAPGLWFEVHAENYMVDGGPRLRALHAVREHHPVSLHGVAMSLAGVDGPDTAHLARLATLVQRIEPVLVSEHLAWSGTQGIYLPDLLPFERTTPALARICRHVMQVQEALGRSIAIENPSHYLHIPGHAWDEIDFLAELVWRSGCTLLLDLNNIFVSAHNLGFDATAWLDRLLDKGLAAHVSEVHLAGHRADANPQVPLLVDSHDAPVAPPVWALYRHFVERAGMRPTLIERDAEVPAFDVLMAERAHAQGLAEAAVLATARHGKVPATCP
jgi:uncharacterized protein (UPF0276 family)